MAERDIAPDMRSPVHGFCECWCCRPIGPSHPEPLSPRTVAQIEEDAALLAKLYYAVHPEERPDA